LHFSFKINLVACLPSLHGLPYVLDDDAGIVLDAALGEGPLKETAVPIMNNAIGRQETVPDEILQAPGNLASQGSGEQGEYEQVTENQTAGNLAVGEVARIFRQDVPNVLRAEEEDNGRRTDIDGRHTLVGALQSQQEAQLIAPERHNVAEQRQALGARGQDVLVLRMEPACGSRVQPSPSEAQ
jgi:hypothetical protein